MFSLSFPRCDIAAGTLGTLLPLFLRCSFFVAWGKSRRVLESLRFHTRPSLKSDFLLSLCTWGLAGIFGPALFLFLLWRRLVFAG